jgi:hypothetical protein
VTWSFVFVNDHSRAELDALPLDVRAVQAFGLERACEPYIKYIEGPIWRCG